MVPKIQEAQEVLAGLGLPPAQQNEISALTLLAVANLREASPWREAKRRSIRIHEIIGHIQREYGRTYAENTRETIRRQVLHQLEQAAIVERNPDQPDLPTNSPRTHYALSEEALAALQSYGLSEWRNTAAAFVARKGALFEVYQRSRAEHQIPLQLPDGREYRLSPGAHNKLQAAIINEFGPNFAKGAIPVYVGDTANKMLHFEEDIFNQLDVTVSSHDKLPDVVLYDSDNNRLFLIEAVTSHGPISAKRRIELEGMFRDSGAYILYVTAFPDFKLFKDNLTSIAWDTEVWLAEIPEHMIHYNGDKFLTTR